MALQDRAIEGAVGPPLEPGSPRVDEQDGGEEAHREGAGPGDEASLEVPRQTGAQAPTHEPREDARRAGGDPSRAQKEPADPQEDERDNEEASKPRFEALLAVKDLLFGRHGLDALAPVDADAFSHVGTANGSPCRGGSGRGGYGGTNRPP